MRRGRYFLVVMMAAALPAGAALAAGDTLPTAEELKKLVDAGQYKDALKPMFRVLALKGAAAAGYDRCEMLQLRAECLLQIKDSRGALDSLEQARKEALTGGRLEKTVEPVGMTLLIQKSNAYQYKPKGAKEGISILDRSKRAEAYGALLAEEMPGAKARVDSLNGAKTMGPVLEAGKAAGLVRALEILSKPEGKVGKLESAELTSKVTTNADRLMTSALDEFIKEEGIIGTNANQIVNDTVPMYDPVSKRAWQQPRTRRRGPTDQEIKTLNGILASCEKMRAAAVELAGEMGTDLAAYQAIANKADGAKGKAGAILADDYLAVPQ